MSSLLTAGVDATVQASALVTTEGTATTLGVFGSEFLGTAVLILMGAGVCAATSLNKSNARGADWINIALGWGLAVFAAVYVSGPSGAHLNPAVTVGQWVAGNDFAPGVSANLSNFVVYLAAQMLGAMTGATLAWLAYKKQFDEPREGGTLSIFSTGPNIKSYGWNLVTEAIGTFVLIGFVVASGMTPSGLGPLAVALIVVGIGLSLGGPTGYAINPARDLGPRIMHSILPIPEKGSSNWSYAWVPVLGPILGAVAAALIIPIFLPL